MLLSWYLMHKCVIMAKCFRTWSENDASFGSALCIMLDTNEKGAGVCVSFADWYSDN